MHNPYTQGRASYQVPALTKRNSEKGMTTKNSISQSIAEGIPGFGYLWGFEATRHLDGILQKLRPFQKEALNFATKGTVSKRQFNSASADTKMLKQVGEQTPGLFQYDQDLIGKGRILLADEMGCGKTVTSLAIMTAYMDEWPLLILCPASLRYTWPAEIEKFLPSILPSAVYVVSGFDDADFFANENKRNRIKVVIATYSLLQNRSAAARVLDQFQFKCVIADESHNLKERNSQRCKLGMPLLQKAKRLVLLTGTPALSRPVELWPQIHCIAPDLFGSYTAFTKQYCNARRGRFGWDVSGLSNADELHHKLRQVMVRRLKSDVLSELPPKQRSIVPVQIDPDRVKECRDLIAEMKEARVSVDQLFGEEAREAHFESRRLLMMGYQTSGIGKVKAVVDYLLDWLAGSVTQKILVFAHHKEVMDTLEQAISKKLKGTGHIRIDGTVSASDRALRVRKFQTNSTIRVGLLSMTAAGVGLTLTAASSVLFAELHWTPGVLAQAEDRCHRIGQQNAVNVMYCVCRDQDLSVDMSLWNMLSRKVGNLGKVIDGCKGASMNVKYADDAIGRVHSSGESEQDELVRFFAETSVEETSSSKREPVKGSILSFFKSAVAATQPPSSIDGSRKRSFDKIAEVTLSKQGPERTTICNAVKWACVTCTFDNERQRTRSGYLACDMCGSPHVESLDDDNDESSPPTLSASTQDSSSSELIIIDESSDEDTKRRKPEDPEIIFVDDDAPASRSAVSPSTRKPKRVRRDSKKNSNDHCTFHFSVSANSGRVHFHSASCGEFLCTGFELADVLTEETNDALLTSAVGRTSSSLGNSQTSALTFDEASLTSVIRGIPESFNSRTNHDRCCYEVKEFVTSYMSLRQVEKEALKSSGKAVSPFHLKQTVARIMSAALKDAACTTERYSGGAKERAEERREKGTATIADCEVLAGKACVWCANALTRTSLAKNVEATYCSQSCAEQGRLRRGGMYASARVREQVFGLEGGVCQQCGIDAHALFLRISALQPAERLNALINANWRLPSARSALERLLQNPKEGDFWQADHIVAVAEGGGSCGLENLRTLCSPCHKIETDKLRARLRLGCAGGDTQASSDGDGPKQMDIRSAFFVSRTTDTRKCPAAHM